MSEFLCPSCQTLVRETDRFCSSCGAKLSADAQARSRFMTVTFIDLAGSTALTESIGGEAMFELTAAYQKLCNQMITDAGGYVARNMGDGILAYFGYPQAMKDSAQTAVSTAQAVVSRVAKMRAPGGVPLGASAGVATGWVVVGEMHEGMPAQETLAIGDTVNMAARLQANATVGTVAISDNVRDLIDPAAHRFEPAGTAEFKGLSEPVAVWTALEATTQSDGTNMVGRGVALSALQDNWTASASGTLRCVTVTAPGGLGKTTLVRHFMETLGDDVAPMILTGQAHQAHQSFACFGRLVRRLAGLKPDQASRQVAQLESWAPEDTAGGLALLLGLDPTPLAPVVRFARIKQALSDLLTSLTGTGHQLLFIEDAHWLDEASVEMLNELTDLLADRPLMILSARRPDGAAVATDKVVEVDLEALSSAEALAMIDMLDPASRIAGSTRKEIVLQARGIPLFIKHMTLAVAERPDTGDLSHVPASLVEAVLERVEGVRNALPLVESAAILGQNFRLDVLAEMLTEPIEHVRLQAGLLVARNVLSDRDGTSFAFDHAVIREVISKSLLTKRRRDLHETAYDCYMRLAPEVAETDPKRMGEHLLGAGRNIEAIPMLLAASRLAMMRAELGECQRLIETAQAALDGIDDEQIAGRLEMAVQFTLGTSLVQSRGFGDPSVGAAYDRALSLCLTYHGKSEEEFQMAWGIWAHKVVVGETDDAERMVERMEEIAQIDEGFDVLANSARSLLSWNLGDYETQDDSYRRVRRLYDFPKHRMQAISYSMDSLGQVLLFQAHRRWIVGDYAGFRKALEDVFEHEARLKLPFLRPYVHIFGRGPYTYCPTDAEYRKRIEEATAFAHEIGQPFWIMSGNMWLAQSTFQQQGAEAALEPLVAALEGVHASGMRFVTGLFEATAALALAQTGQLEAARECIAPALAEVEAGRNNMYAPEILRQYALTEALTSDPDRRLIRTTLDKARGMARRQGARAWQAMIAASEARLRLENHDEQSVRSDLEQTLAAIKTPEMTGHPALSFFDTGSGVDQGAPLEVQNTVAS